jgi:hypothetical protein
MIAVIERDRPAGARIDGVERADLDAALAQPVEVDLGRTQRPMASYSTLTRTPWRRRSSSSSASRRPVASSSRM